MEFSDLVKIEPKLADLWNRARNACPVCADSLWEQPGGFKTELQLLVGWWAVKAELQSSDYYSLAYDRLNTRALPMPPGDQDDKEGHERGEYCYYPSDGVPDDEREPPPVPRQLAAPDLAGDNAEAVRAELRAMIDQFRREQERLKAAYGWDEDECDDEY